MLLMLFILKASRRYPGHHLWFIRKLAKLPYGSLFFQEGEYFDCGICISGNWKEARVVALACNELHVFHEECLREQVEQYSNKYCVLCYTPTVIAPCEKRPEPENPSIICGSSSN